MTGGELLTIGIIGAGAIIGLDYVARAWREMNAEEEAFSFGDVVELPDEAKTSRPETFGGGWSEAKADRLDTQHNDGSLTSRPGAK